MCCRYEGEALEEKQQLRGVVRQRRNMRKPYGRLVDTLKEPYGGEVSTAREPYGRVMDTAMEPYERTVDTAKEPYGRAVDTAKEPYGRVVDTAKEPYGRAVDTAREPYGGEVSTARKPITQTARQVTKPEPFYNKGKAHRRRTKWSWKTLQSKSDDETNPKLLAKDNNRQQEKMKLEGHENEEEPWQEKAPEFLVKPEQMHAPQVQGQIHQHLWQDQKFEQKSYGQAEQDEHEQHEHEQDDELQHQPKLPHPKLDQEHPETEGRKPVRVWSSNMYTTNFHSEHKLEVEEPQNYEMQVALIPWNPTNYVPTFLRKKTIPKRRSRVSDMKRFGRNLHRRASARNSLANPATLRLASPVRWIRG